jgi:hypothetical protein
MASHLTMDKLPIACLLSELEVGSYALIDFRFLGRRLGPRRSFLPANCR